MKRIAVFILFLLCAVCIFAQQNGVITEFSGTVELKNAGAGDFVPARSGDTVAGNTIISTGFKSTAIIRVGSAVLTVRPLTRLTLSEISSSAGTEIINLNLQAGRVRVDVSPPAGTRTALSITSPVATASVRGTSFEFETQGLNVYEGRVAYQGASGGMVIVSAGSASEVSANGSPADPAEVYITSLQPAPPAGREAGYRRNASAAEEDFTFTIIFK